MVIKHGGPLIEAPGVPGVVIPECRVVKMMAEFVAERTEKCPVRGDLLANSSLHPDADELGLGIIISKELSGPALAATDWAGRENTNWGPFHFVEMGCDVQKLSTFLSD